MAAEMKNATEEVRTALSEAKGAAAKFAEKAKAARENMQQAFSMANDFIDEMNRDVAEFRAVLGGGTNNPPPPEPKKKGIFS